MFFSKSSTFTPFSIKINRRGHAGKEGCLLFRKTICWPRIFVRNNSSLNINPKRQICHFEKEVTKNYKLFGDIKAPFCIPANNQTPKTNCLYGKLMDPNYLIIPLLWRRSEYNPIGLHRNSDVVKGWAIWPVLSAEKCPQKTTSSHTSHTVFYRMNGLNTHNLFIIPIEAHNGHLITHIPPHRGDNTMGKLFGHRAYRAHRPRPNWAYRP